MASTRLSISITLSPEDLRSPGMQEMSSMEEYQQWLNDPQAQKEYQMWCLRDEQRRAALPDPLQGNFFGESK